MADGTCALRFSSGDVAGHELDDDGRALATLVHAETLGNPLFVGEVLRHLVETGTVQRVDGR